MTARLHCFGESGNAYKAALALTLAGIDWEPVFVDFFNGETRGEAFRALNVMGEVPVLEAEGEVLTQSGAILLWAARRTGRLGAGSEKSMRWVLFDAHKMSGQAGTLRFNMNFLAPERRDPAVIAWLSMRVQSALKVLEAQLARTPFLAGDEVTIGDVACCGYLFYPEPFGFDRAEWPAVDAWLGRVAALPGWRHPYDMMPRVPGLSPSLPA